MIEALEALVRAAVKAPSGDNLQPWRFLLDAEAGRVTLAVDEARDASPMNSGQRMSRIACGAALENMLRTANRNGWMPRLVPGESQQTHCVELGAAQSRCRQDAALDLRATNRRVYERLPFPGHLEEQFRHATPVLNGVETCWTLDRERIQAFALLEGRAFEFMYGLSPLRRAIIENIRFDASANEAVEDGLSTGSLELNRIQQMLLRALGVAPDWLLRHGGALHAMARHVRRLVNSATGLCVILAPDGRPETDFAVGRCMQRAWLALTEAGLAGQPMMAAPVMENLRAHGSQALRARVDTQGLQSLLKRWPGVIPQAKVHRPAFVLRFGYAQAPTGRTGRRPLQEVRQRILSASTVAEVRA